jgi:hypothetical protein
LLKIFIFAEITLDFTLFILFLFSNRYQDALWEAGGMNGWNSDPKLRIYFYANHKDPPAVPMIWSQRYAARNVKTVMVIQNSRPVTNSDQSKRFQYSRGRN